MKGLRIQEEVEFSGTGQEMKIFVLEHALQWQLERFISTSHPETRGILACRLGALFLAKAYA
jgi:hypothetical protein